MDIFVHIPKTGGSTIRSILSREYGSQRILYYQTYTDNDDTSLITPPEKLNQIVDQGKVRLITGHTSFGIHEIINKSCRYFSMVRDPIDRALSDYYFAYKYNFHKYKNEIRTGQISPIEFISNNKYMPIPYQIGTLISQYTSPDPKISLEFINKYYDIIGIAERFEESMLLIAKILCWKPPIFFKRNITKISKSQIKERSLTRAYAQENLKELYSYDYTIYNAINNKLSDIIKNEGKTYKIALDSYLEIQKTIENLPSKKIYYQYNFRENDFLPDSLKYIYESTPYKEIQKYINPLY